MHYRHERPMSYRNPPTTPVFVMFDELLLALDASTGDKLWLQRLPMGRHRLFRVGDLIIVTLGGQVTAYDVATGRLLGGAVVGFDIDAGVVHDQKLYLAGQGVACIDHQGRVAWKVERRAGETFLSTVSELVGQDGTGAVTWSEKIDFAPAPPCAIAIGNELAQADRRD